MRKNAPPKHRIYISPSRVFNDGVVSMTQFSLDLSPRRRPASSSSRSTTHLDAQFRVLRRAVGRVLTLARERRVVVVLARHHPQHGFHGVQGAVVEQFLGRFYASVQHVPQPVDPRDLQLCDD